MGSGDIILDLPACKASMLLIEQSPLPPISIFTKYSYLYFYTYGMRHDALMYVYIVKWVIQDIYHVYYTMKCLW